MDYYVYGLAYGLGQNDVFVNYYTCDKTKERHFKNVKSFFIFRNLWEGSAPVKLKKYIYGHFKAFRHLRKNNIKLLHLHFYFFRSVELLVLLLSKYFRFKIIVTVHDVNSFHNKSSLIIEKKCYSLIDGVIVHNRASYNSLMAKQLFKKNIAVIPHGNYLPFINRLQVRNVKAGNSFNILFFGQIKEVKGLDVLLNGLAIMVKSGYSNIRLIIKGKAYKNDLSKYTTLIQQLGIAQNVECDFRYIPDDEVEAIYANADVVVLPYREIYQSGVLLLTMSYGRPVICSDLGPFKELVTHKVSALIFKSGDDNDLADKIKFAVNNKDILNNITKNADEIIKRDFDWVKIGMKTREFYNEILES